MIVCEWVCTCKRLELREREREKRKALPRKSSHMNVGLCFPADHMVVIYQMHNHIMQKNVLNNTSDRSVLLITCI